MKAREELRLVERFDELRAGMIVVLKPCLRCKKAHRGMLTTSERCEYHRRIGDGPSECVSGLAWNVVPKRPCTPKEPVIAPHTVDQRRLFRVVDGLESDTSTAEQARRPERVR